MFSWRAIQRSRKHEKSRMSEKLVAMGSRVLHFVSFANVGCSRNSVSWIAVLKFQKRVKSNRIKFGSVPQFACRRQRTSFQIQSDGESSNDESTRILGTNEQLWVATTVIVFHLRCEALSERTRFRIVDGYILDWGHFIMCIMHLGIGLSGDPLFRGTVFA